MKKLSSSTLVLGAGVTFVVFGISPHDTFHPLITIASLLPIQLGALLWLKSNGYLAKVLEK